MNEELKIIISAEMGKLETQLNKAKKSLKQYAQEGTKDMKALGSEMKKYSDKTDKLLKVAGAAVVGATTALLGLSAATADYRNSQAKLVTAFESAGATAETAKATYNDLYRVLGESDTAVEASAHLAKLTQDQQALSEWATVCQGVYATFGDSLPIEGLTEAANETAKVGELTGVLADALNWAGVNETTFNEQLAACNSEAEREALIRGTLNGLYSEAAANYEANNAQVLAHNEAQAQMQEALGKVGEALAPLNTMLLELGADILTQLTPYIEDFCANHLPELKELLEEVGEKIGKVITWIADNWDLITTIGGIILAVSLAISAVSAAIAFYNTVMAIAAAVSAPVSVVVLAIVAAVAALSAAIFVCIKYWDKIKEKVSNVIDNMKAKVKAGVDKIKGFFKFDWSLPKLKLPHFSITGEFSLMPPKIPHFSVDWYAQGGVFDKPTLFGYGGGSIGGLGEAGAEAVVPLERNTKWLSRLADMLTERQGRTPIVLNVDGKTFATTAIGTINDLTKQTGSLGLVIN